jgi:hypothetical protein
MRARWRRVGAVAGWLFWYTKVTTVLFGVSLLACLVTTAIAWIWVLCAPGSRAAELLGGLGGVILCQGGPLLAMALAVPLCVLRRPEFLWRVVSRAAGER